jgi:hypothetical protein
MHLLLHFVYFEYYLLVHFDLNLIDDDFVDCFEHIEVAGYMMVDYYMGVEFGNFADYDLLLYLIVLAVDYMAVVDYMAAADYMAVVDYMTVVDYMAVVDCMVAVGNVDWKFIVLLNYFAIEVYLNYL